MDNKTRYMKAGLLAERQSWLARLEVKADRCVKEINVKLFSSDGVRGLEIEAAQQAFAELVETVAAWKAAMQEIKRIEANL